MTTFQTHNDDGASGGVGVGDDSGGDDDAVDDNDDDDNFDVWSNTDNI